MELFFAKIVKNYNYFSEALYLRPLTGFRIHLTLNKYSLTCRVTPLSMYCMTHIQGPVCYRKFRHIHVLFRHIQPYCGIFRTLCNSYIIKSWYIQNPDIFRTQDVFRTLSRYILAYSKRCVTLAYCEPFYIQKLVIFRILAYLGSDAYS